MQTLNTLSTPEEKLAALCKKYAELVSFPPSHTPPALESQQATWHGVVGSLIPVEPLSEPFPHLTGESNPSQPLHG